MTLLQQNRARVKAKASIECKRFVIATHYGYYLCHQLFVTKPGKRTAHQFASDTLAAQMLLHIYRINLRNSFTRNCGDAISDGRIGWTFEHQIHTDALCVSFGE